MGGFCRQQAHIFAPHYVVFVGCKQQGIEPRNLPRSGQIVARAAFL